MLLSPCLQQVGGRLGHVHGGLIEEVGGLLSQLLARRLGRVDGYEGRLLGFRRTRRARDGGLVDLVLGAVLGRLLNNGDLLLLRAELADAPAATEVEIEETRLAALGVFVTGEMLSAEAAAGTSGRHVSGGGGGALGRVSAWVSHSRVFLAHRALTKV